MPADLAGPMKVTDATARSRFELPVEGQVAHLDYRQVGDTLVLVHTEVPPALGGRGLGGLLARAALDAARERGLKVRATCPFVRDWIARHPEFADLVHD
jgi:predicted GNAT family acetyltransferase